MTPMTPEHWRSVVALVIAVAGAGLFTLVYEVCVIRRGEPTISEAMHVLGRQQPMTVALASGLTVFACCFLAWHFYG